MSPLGQSVLIIGGRQAYLSIVCTTTYSCFCCQTSVAYILGITCACRPVPILVTGSACPPKQVHSELPVSTAAIVHVLLHRLATIRPGKEVTTHCIIFTLYYCSMRIWLLLCGQFLPELPWLPYVCASFLSLSILYASVYRESLATCCPCISMTYLRVLHTGSGLLCSFLCK